MSKAGDKGDSVNTNGVVDTEAFHALGKSAEHLFIWSLASLIIGKRNTRNYSRDGSIGPLSNDG